MESKGEEPREEMKEELLLIIRSRKNSYDIAIRLLNEARKILNVPSP